MSVILADNLTTSIFPFFTRAAKHIEPIFRMVAGLEQNQKAKWHGWAPIGLPGAKFHAMTGQSEKSHLVRLARKYARAFRDQVLRRPDYYASFDRYNRLKM